MWDSSPFAPLDVSREPVTDILPFIILSHCYTNVYVSSDIWSHGVLKHINCSKKLESSTERKSDNRSPSGLIKWSKVN